MYGPNPRLLQRDVTKRMCLTLACFARHAIRNSFCCLASQISADRLVGRRSGSLPLHHCRLHVAPEGSRVARHEFHPH